MFTLANIIAAILTLIPFLAAAFAPLLSFAAGGGPASRTRITIRLLRPAVLCIPYILVTASTGTFSWRWCALYALLPVAIATLLHQARQADIHNRGNWRDYLILATLGLAVDLRWFEPAWPLHLAIFNKIILLDAGIYGFLFIRQLSGVGFDLRLRARDFTIGLREFAIYAPIAIALGLALGFLHFHDAWPPLIQFAIAPIFTFFFIAVPEELFFRGWTQNLLERRIGRTPALILTAILFGLSHFNKRAAHFNWRYVLLAAIAGIFYGRAWHQQRRVGASAITHTAVDSLWSLWLR
jgi:membrane protease YdiL (CAAX protease family)